MVHVVGSPKKEFLAVITAYLPDSDEWGPGLTKRIEKLNCVHCQGKMKKASAPFHVDRKGYHLSLTVVPAWVCPQCGEPYFEEREVNTIQRLLTQLDRQTATLASVA